MKTPKEQIQDLQAEIRVLTADLQAKWKQISDIEGQCKHSWSGAKSSVRRIEYDVGQHGGSYDQWEWERECVDCGKKQKTTKQKSMQVPDFKEI